MRVSKKRSTKLSVNKPNILSDSGKPDTNLYTRKYSWFSMATTPDGTEEIKKAKILAPSKSQAMNLLIPSHASRSVLKGSKSPIQDIYLKTEERTSDTKLVKGQAKLHGKLSLIQQKIQKTKQSNKDLKKDAKKLCKIESMLKNAFREKEMLENKLQERRESVCLEETMDSFRRALVEFLDNRV